MTFIANQLVHEGVVKTTCAYCGVGCGVLAEIDASKPVSEQALIIKGDPEHPANFGRLCVKGSALGETVHPEGRLLHPAIGGVRSDWDQATTYIAEQFKAVIAEHGADAVAFYVSGQLLTEDYYVVNKLAKGFIGTGNVDTNSRLCMSSAVAGHKRAFGTDTVPNSYGDFEKASLIILVGSNTAWCHPILFQRIKAAKAANPHMKVVVIDPRATATNEIADLHLPIKGGTDVLLFNHLLVQLADAHALDHDYIHQYTDGIDMALAAARADVAIGDVAYRLGVDHAALDTFVTWFIDHPKAMTLFSMGVNQSGQGTDKVNAIINVHLATGRIGQEGAGPFSLTGQPNAMGGREVGGLANMLAAHLEIHEPSHRALVQEFWQSPRIIEQSGLKAVDLFDAVATGKVKAVWIMATNPIVSMPNADEVRAALAACPLVIVSEVMADTDCTRVADVVLPAMGWSEKDGTVTNSERRISRQRAVVPAAGEARPDWWALADVARKMGFAGFEYQHPYDVFVEHARLSGYQADRIRRDFDISGLADLSFEEYQQFAPVQWPVPKGQRDGQARFFAQGAFYTPNQRARMVAVSHQPTGYSTSDEYPFVLNTGRIRDQWHTMSRTGLTARLTRHISEPFAELHPVDAAALDVVTGDLLTVRSAWGQATARVLINEGQQRGMVFVPIHWNGVNSSQSRVGGVVNPVVDPYSGQPELKFTPVHLSKAHCAVHGFVLSAQALPLLSADYAVQVRVAGGVRQEFAGAIDLTTWPAQLTEQLAIPVDAERMEYIDLSRQVTRLAWIAHGRLVAVAVTGQSDALPPRAWLDSLLGHPIDAAARRSLLSGVAADPEADVGAIVCSCFGVGKNTICRAIKDQALTTVAMVGQCLKAGTNCGSCQSEIAKLIEQVSARASTDTRMTSTAQDPRSLGATLGE
jgi:assimilatory nitrate reductase catalytic subunit